MNKAFSKIWIVIVLVIVITGGILGWRYWSRSQESIPKGLTKEEMDQAVKCIKDRSILKSRFCQVDLGRKTGNLKVCNYIDSFTNIPAGSWIFMIGNPSPLYCRGGVAAARNNFSICKDSQFNNFQRNRCYQGIAIALNDKNICEEMREESDSISKQEAQDFCYEELSVIREDLSGCLAVSYELTCYSFLAAMKEDLTFCNKLSNSKKEKCLSRVSFLNPFSKDICREIKSSSGKEHCYTAIAGAEKDLTICKKHAPTDECYQGVALKTKDSDLCNLISDKKDRRMCIRVIGEIRDFEKEKGVSL